MLANYYNDSPYQLIKDMFPEYKWFVWMFKYAPKNVWRDTAIRRDCVLWLGEKLGYNNKDDWYGISMKTIHNNYGIGLLSNYYDDSPYSLIKDVFPEDKWLVWMFKVTPNGMWKDYAIRKRYIEWLGERLGFNNKEDWYGISVQAIYDNYGMGLLKYLQ